MTETKVGNFHFIFISPLISDVCGKCSLAINDYNFCSNFSPTFSLSRRRPLSRSMVRILWRRWSRRLWLVNFSTLVYTRCCDFYLTIIPHDQLWITTCPIYVYFLVNVFCLDDTEDAVQLLSMFLPNVRRLDIVNQMIKVCDESKFTKPLNRVRDLSLWLDFDTTQLAPMFK